MNRLRSAALLFVLIALAAQASSAVGDPTERLADAIRHRTVSFRDRDQRDDAAFRALHSMLERRFPKTHRALRRETVAELSLLYTWAGSDPALAPLLLIAHTDVVPVPEDALGRWTHPPFDGVIEDGYVWGRGAMDDKASALAALEAVERLVGSGFTPRRGVLLAFGHDEEVGGPDGAGGTAALLRERGVRPWLSLDEGLAIVRGGLAGVAKPLALIGVAEKGSATVRVVARAPGGHSSVPGPTTAIGRLAGAISRLESQRMPARLDGVVDRMLDALAPHQSFGYRMLSRGRPVTSPLLLRGMTGTPVTNALVRTTTAVTMVSGGVKTNVLPASASATVNFRVRPGDTPDDVRRHVERVVGEGFDVELLGGREASPVSSTEGDAWSLLERSIAAVFPDTPVVPGLVVGGTDTKHYVNGVEHAYRFMPVAFEATDLARIHGVDERIGVEDYGRMIDFYVHLIESGTGP